jgi:TP901 family phage tail tape measure protein
MNRTKRDVLLVVLKGEHDRVAEVVQEVVDEHGHHTREEDIWDAAYRLACAGYDADGIGALLPTVVQYSSEFAVDAERLAERTAETVAMYGIDEENVDEVLERARMLAVQKSLTVDDVFDVLERLGPTLMSA